MTTPETPADVVTFADGLPGFEEAREFVLVASPDLDPFTVVRGIGDGAPAFVAIDPRRLDDAFETTLPPSDRVRLQARPDTPLLWLALVSVRADAPATVNLRAPLVINPQAMTGIQLVAADSRYRVDHPLAV